MNVGEKKMESSREQILELLTWLYNFSQKCNTQTHHDSFINNAIQWLIDFCVWVYLMCSLDGSITYDTVCMGRSEENFVESISSSYI